MRTLHPVIKALMNDPKGKKALTELMFTKKDAVMSVLSAARKRLGETFEGQVYVEPSLEELLSNFASGRVALDSIEQAFWHLRVQNEELKEMVKGLKLENSLLRAQNE